MPSEPHAVPVGDFPWSRQDTSDPSLCCSGPLSTGGRPHIPKAGESDCRRTHLTGIAHLAKRQWLASLANRVSGHGLSLQPHTLGTMPLAGHRSVLPSIGDLWRIPISAL